MGHVRTNRRPKMVGHLNRDGYEEWIMDKPANTAINLSDDVIVSEPSTPPPLLLLLLLPTIFFMSYSHVSYCYSQPKHLTTCFPSQLSCSHFPCFTTFLVPFLILHSPQFHIKFPHVSQQFSQFSLFITSITFLFHTFSCFPFRCIVTIIITGITNSNLHVFLISHIPQFPQYHTLATIIAYF